MVKIARDIVELDMRRSASRRLPGLPPPAPLFCSVASTSSPPSPCLLQFFQRVFSLPSAHASATRYGQEPDGVTLNRLALVELHTGKLDQVEKVVAQMSILGARPWPELVYVLSHKRFWVLRLNMALLQSQFYFYRFFRFFFFLFVQISLG